MTKLIPQLSVIVFLLLGLAARGQEKDQTYYQVGNPLRPEVTGYYRNGLKDSFWVYQGRNGTDSAGDYRNGKKEGYWVMSDGNSSATGDYVNDLRQGEWIYYKYRVRNEKIAQGNFVLGKKEGTWWEHPPGGLVRVGRYVNGLRDGQWALSWETGDSVGFINYKDGILDGKFKHWQPNYYRMEGRFCKGKPCGEWVYSYPSGIVFERVIHRPETRDSLIIERCLASGQQTIFDGKGSYINVYKGVKTVEGHVAGGLREGPFIYRSLEGDTTAIQNYSRGMLNGKSYAYIYSDSTVTYSIYEYSNGKLHGKSISFQNDSTFTFKAEYRNGLLHGKKRIWGGSGNKVLIFEAGYRNGKADGNWVERYYNGSVKYEKKYRDGYLVDTLHWYSKDGSMQQQAYYDSTKNLWKVNYRDGAGKLFTQFYAKDTLYEGCRMIPNKRSPTADSLLRDISKSKFEIRCDTFRSWYGNGQLKKLWPYEEGKRDGVLLEWDSLGNLASSIEMENGEQQGYIRKYYQNGQMREESSYLVDNSKGSKRKWYPSGNPESEIFFKYGMQDSLFHLWDDDGNLLAKGSYELGRMEGEWRFFIDGYEKAIDYYANRKSQNIRYRYPDGTPFYQQSVNDSLFVMQVKLFHPNGKLWMDFQQNEDGYFFQYYGTKNQIPKVKAGQGRFRIKTENGMKIKVVVTNGRLSHPDILPFLFPNILTDERWSILEEIVGLGNL